MTQQFTPVEVGDEFPEAKAGRQHKYVTDEAMDLLLKNKGKVFLISEITGLGNYKGLMNVGTPMRHAGKYKKFQFETANPNLIFEFAVRQSIKEMGGVVRMYAKISDRWLKHTY